MRILSLFKRSIHHDNFNEDFLFKHQLTEDLMVCTVMDGCSSAKDSHFSSALYNKSLHKSCRMLPHMKEIMEDFDLGKIELDAIGDFILKQLFDDLKKTQRMFFLAMEELLSTIVLLVYNNKNKTAFIAVSGDGIFYINKELTEIDQNNVPNFLGYHLKENFDSVAKTEIQSWHFENVIDVSISTDGIDKFRKNIKDSKELSVTHESFFMKLPQSNKDIDFEKQYDDFVSKGFIPHDDISLIRILNP